MNRIKSEKGQQWVFIIEAAFEYFISLMVTGAFLTKILNQAQIPDAVSGILSSIAVLSYTAQIVSSLLARARGKYKSTISVLVAVNELVFALLYLVPFINIPHQVKTIILIGMLLFAQLVLNFEKTSKLNWITSQVPITQLGTFTAKKESISLVTGMLFTLGMGKLIDYFENIGNIRAGFYITCIVMIAISILHILTLVLCNSPKQLEDAKEQIGVVGSIKELLSDSSFRKLIIVDVLWHMTSGTTAFNGVYQVNTLGFSLTFISFITIIASVTRILFSFPVGKLADKTSYAKMMNVEFVIAGLSFVAYMFTTPSNGKIMFTLFLSLYYASMAGVNGGLINIIFDYIPFEKRTSAIGIKYALGGVVGFIATLVGSVVVNAVQKADNKIFGFTVYPQQLLAFVSLILCIVVVIYMKNVVSKLKVTNRK